MWGVNLLVGLETGRSLDRSGEGILIGRILACGDWLHRDPWRGGGLVVQLKGIIGSRF